MAKTLRSEAFRSLKSKECRQILPDNDHWPHIKSDPGSRNAQQHTHSSPTDRRMKNPSDCHRIASI
ncbi:unnamed protein product [Nesidiocoris tenuis]|uniref:Uncharacterized protein n=1 Tax=Nesidiocoris tenuis TaxID=355587 RepID=A0A6H5GTT2_9HEMI|nr:unnamed protein product [Nesidiocoris tenuis]